MRRGEQPELVTEGVTLSYALEEAHRRPSEHSRFWDFSEAYLGQALPADVGLSGLGVQGEMSFSAGLGSYQAPHLPVVPIRDDGAFQPYPLAEITATSQETGEVIARTSTAAREERTNLRVTPSLP